MVDFDDAVGLGLGAGLSRALWRGHRDGVEMGTRMNILTESERDRLRRRQRERDAEPEAVTRWRFHDGAWQRWSELDHAFVPMQPPGSLLEHAAATGGPVEDEELVFDGGSWGPVGDLAEEGAGPEAPTAPAVDPWAQSSAPTPPPQPPAGGATREADDFEAQLEAWRRRG